MANNKVIKRVNGSLGNVVNNSIIYRDVYNVSNVGDEGTEYHCHAVINNGNYTSVVAYSYSWYVAIRR